MLRLSPVAQIIFNSVYKIVKIVKHYLSHNVTEAVVHTPEKSKSRFERDRWVFKDRARIDRVKGRTDRLFAPG